MHSSQLSPPLVSVVIPTYNAEKYIESAINSVQVQSLKNIEIIIINDGSTDNSEEIIDSLKLSDPRISLYTQKNSGKPAIARNVGCARAKGKYISFMDSDDIMLPGKLEAQVNAFDKIQDAALIFHDWSLITDDGELITAARLQDIDFLTKASKYLCHYDKDIYTTNEQYYNFASTQTLGILTIAVMIKRDTLLTEKEWFPEDMDIGEDLDLWFRILQRHKAVFINQVFCQYRSNPDSITKNIERMIIGLINAQTKNLTRGFKQFTAQEKQIMRHKLASRHRSLAYHYYTNDINNKLAKKHNIKCFMLHSSLRNFLSILKALVQHRH